MGLSHQNALRNCEHDRGLILTLLMAKIMALEREIKTVQQVITTVQAQQPVPVAVPTPPKSGDPPTTQALSHGMGYALVHEDAIVGVYDTQAAAAAEAAKHTAVLSTWSFFIWRVGTPLPTQPIRQ